MIYSMVFGAIRICCDECENEPENVGFTNYRDAASWAKKNGWIIRKDANGELETICPECTKESSSVPQT